MKCMLDVYFYEAFEEETKEIRHCLGADQVVGFTCKTIQESSPEKPPASVISTRTQSVIPPFWGDHLTGVLTRSTGFDHITKFLKESGKDIPCGYLPEYCSRAVAEQAMLLWTSLLRKLPLQIEHFKKFYRDGLTGVECQNRTLLVVGVGNIGFEIVKIAEGLGMEVLGVDPVERYASVNYVSIEDGLPRAEVIVCAMNLTLRNIGYFNYDLLKKAKRGTVFVNIARGELSPANDLLRLVEEAHLGGVGLDVYNNERELAVSLRKGEISDDEEVGAILKLSKFPNVILTPHNAFNTEEAVHRKAEQSVKQLRHFFKQGGFIWPVPES